MNYLNKKSTAEAVLSIRVKCLSFVVYNCDELSLKIVARDGHFFYLP